MKSLLVHVLTHPHMSSVLDHDRNRLEINGLEDSSTEMSAEHALLQLTEVREVLMATNQLQVVDYETGEHCRMHRSQY